MGTARYYPQSFSPSSANPSLRSPGVFRTWAYAYVIAGVALLSALTVFIALCERDKSILLTAESRERISSVVPSRSASLPAVSTAALPAADSVTRITVPTAVVKDSTPATHVSRRVVDFTLARSRRFQQVGPVSVGVWKVDVKHKLYDLSLLTGTRRFDRKQVSLNSPIIFPSNDPARPFQLVVNSIGRNSISGYLTAPGSR